MRSTNVIGGRLCGGEQQEGRGGGEEACGLPQEPQRPDQHEPVVQELTTTPPPPPPPLLLTMMMMIAYGSFSVYYLKKVRLFCTKIGGDCCVLASPPRHSMPLLQFERLPRLVGGLIVHLGKPLCATKCVRVHLSTTPKFSIRD